MSDKHTEGPLEVQHWKDGIFVRPVAEGAPTQRIASMVLTERMSGLPEEVWASQPYLDAERIALTWNCHDDLVEKLEEWRSDFCDDKCAQLDEDEHWEECSTTSTLIAKARGQS